MGALVHSAREPAAPCTRTWDPLLHMGPNLYVTENRGRGPAMDLKEGLEALSKRSTFSTKRVAFLAIAGLCLVAGILLRSGQYFAPPEVEQNAPVTPSPSPADATSAVKPTESIPQPPTPAQDTATTLNEQKQEAVEEPVQAGEAVEQAEQPQGSAMILVSRQPIAMLASPSSSASVLYGFPAGRAFRLISRDGGFAQIQDMKSGASGWIDEAALAPPRVPVASAHLQPRPYSVSRISPLASARPMSQPYSVSRKPPNPSAGPKPKTAKNNSTATADSEAATQPVRQRPGLFGGGGLLRGIFGNGN